MDKFLNVRILANPWNWVKVTLMVLLAYLVLELILHWIATQSPNVANSSALEAQ